MALRSYRNAATAAIAAGLVTKQTLKVLPRELHYAAYKRIVYLDNIETLDSLIAWSGLHLEKLTGDRKGQLSIRINLKYRICFRFKAGDIFDLEIVDYH